MSFTSFTIRVNSRGAVVTPKVSPQSWKTIFFGLKSQIFLRLSVNWNMKISERDWVPGIVRCNIPELWVSLFLL